MSKGHSELFIGYNGTFLSDSYKESHRKAGTILTRSGRVYYRERRDESWEDVKTPSTFLFLDNTSRVTYAVNEFDRSIVEAHPCGKVLDCTNRTVYEIRDSKWIPVCDLSDQTTQTIIRTTTFPASHLNKRPGEIENGLQRVLYDGDGREISINQAGRFVDGETNDDEDALLRNCAMVVSFDVLGENPEVICETTEIGPEKVDLCRGFLTQDAVPHGSSAVLTYQTYYHGQKVIVVQIFNRERFNSKSAAGRGQFAKIIGFEQPLIALPTYNNVNPQQEVSVNRFLVPIAEDRSNLVPVVNWTINYDSIRAFDPRNGYFHVPESGAYKISIVLSYCSLGLLRPTEVSTTTTWFALIKFYGNMATERGKILAIAPITKYDYATIDLQDQSQIGQSVFDVGANLKYGDILAIYYIDDIPSTIANPLSAPTASGNLPGNVTNTGFRLIRDGTTFNVEYVG